MLCLRECQPLNLKYFIQQEYPPKTNPTIWQHWSAWHSPFLTLAKMRTVLINSSILAILYKILLFIVSYTLSQQHWYILLQLFEEEFLIGCLLYLDEGKIIINQKLLGTTSIVWWMKNIFSTWWFYWEISRSTLKSVKCDKCSNSQLS